MRKRGTGTSCAFLHELLALPPFRSSWSSRTRGAGAPDADKAAALQHSSLELRAWYVLQAWLSSFPEDFDAAARPQGQSGARPL